MLADYTPNFVHDGQCLKLAGLHSAAVDYPKSGIPVATNNIPRQPKRKPDWHAPETVDADDLAENYYTSQSAIGQLFRDITLPNVIPTRKRKAEVEDNLVALNDAMSTLTLSPEPQDPISKAVWNHFAKLRPGREFQDSQDVDWVRRLFSTYAGDLYFICRHHTLVLKKGSHLSEEEVVIGTILAKTSQSRRRQDRMSQMRQYATELVKQVQDYISGDDLPALEQVQRSWMAWKLSRVLAHRDVFGVESFGIIAIWSFLDAVSALENGE
jgi:RNA-dependent RNA polymerase